MAMHRRHNPAAGGGGANPFTGRSLPAGRSAGGGGYHGNSPSLVPMAKKAVALLLTFVIFFYVIFAPEYDDGSYETNRQPSIKKKESASDAMNSSFVDLSKKPQTEPVKLNLPSEITPDPNDSNEVEREEEKQVESPDYEDQRIGEKEEEEEGMAYDSNDPDEQSKDSIGEDNESSDEDNTAEAESQLSPAEKIYGAHMHADEIEEGSKDHFQTDPFLGLGDESEEKEDEEAALDNSRGGLRGSKSANNKDPFGRQETTDDDEKKEDEEEDQVVESSQDDPENVIGDETFYKNQSPLEVPNTVVEDESTKSNHTKSMADAIDEHGTDIAAVITPCQDDPDFRYKGHEEHNCEYVSEREKCDKLHSGEKVGIVSCPVSCNMVDECLASLQEQEGSHVATKKNETNVRTFDEKEKFSSKEKAAFEAKYGSAHKSMEEEVNKQDALESNEFNNQAPLEIPVVDVSDVIELNQTEVGHSMKNSSGFSMEEDVDKQLKSMADEVEMEGKDSNDEDVKTNKTEDSGDYSKTDKKGLSDSHKVNTTTYDLDAEEENESNDEDNDEATKAKLDSSAVVVDADGDFKVNKTASLVEENFKEYLITNSEDEPNKDEKNSEDRGTSLEKNEDDEATAIVKDDIISKDDEGKESGDEEGNAEDHDETVQNNGSQDDSEQGEGADEDSKDKKTGVDKKSVSVKGKIEDTDELLKNSEGSNDASEQGEVADEDSKDKKTVVDKVSKYDSDDVETAHGDNEALESPKEVLASEFDKNKESVAEDEDKAEDTDELLKNSGDESNDGLEQGEDADEDAEAKKTASIRGAVDKQSKNDSQEVGKDLDLSSPEGGKARKDDKKEESVVEEEGEAEDTDETVKNKRSTDASEKVDKVVKDSKAKKTKSIRGAAHEKSSKATQNVGSTFEEGKQTAEDEFVKRSGDSSVQGDDADEESKQKSIGSKDESQEVNTDLGNSQVLPNNGNETTSQIDKSEGASESVRGAKGGEDDKEEGGDDVDSEGKKVASIGSSLGDSIKEIDAVKDTEHIKTDPEDSADDKVSKLIESEEKADESTAQNEDQESSDNLVGASRDKKYGESDVSEKVKDDIKYAKIASDSKEPAAKKDASDKETGEKGKAKGKKTEDSPVEKDEKVISILGDLGEAIKESDAPGSDEEAATDKKDVVRSSKDDKSVSPKENDEEVKEVAKGKDKTAKKDRKRKEKK
eukprot:scaffold4824_cov193-Skeletonema_marinoi.AAC.8